MKLYIVATILNQPDEGDVFSDVILITDDERQARTTKYQVKHNKHVPGLDYSLLANYNDVIYFERELNQVIQNREAE